MHLKLVYTYNSPSPCGNTVARDIIRYQRPLHHARKKPATRKYASKPCFANMTNFG